jgi:hypothetical protein
MAEQKIIRQQLERIGPAKVKILLLSGNLSSQLTEEASTWLSELEDDERARNEASQASQMRTALSAKKAAWIAAIAAIIAAMVAIISTVITYLSWTGPVH